MASNADVQPIHCS